MNVDCFIDFHDSKMPFTIQPRCRLGRLNEVVSQSLGITIKDIIHISLPSQKQTKLVNFDKYLIEDYHIKNNDVIRIISDDPVKLTIPNNLGTQIFLVYKNVRLPVSIGSTTQVRHIIQIVRQNYDIVPGTVKLFYKGQELKNITKKLIDDLHFQNNDVINVEGTYFPISLFHNLSFIENQNIHLSKNCCICLEKNDTPKVFDCGHANVCNNCSSKYNKQKCPICFNK